MTIAWGINYRSGMLSAPVDADLLDAANWTVSIAVCRTAFDDATGGAHNNHDANYLTFHRVRSFRDLKDAK